MAKIGADDLKQLGLKVTQPRLRVLEILQQTRSGHLNAEAIHQELLQADSAVGIATVYRVLAQFEEVGLVTKHNFEGGHSVYELHTDSHHDHMVCLGCGLVQEFVDTTIEERQDQIAKEHEFTITGHSMTIYGYCRNCRD